MGDTRERILLTALHLFAAEGYEAVSVSDIAGALGMTKGALYRHYKNKRDIFDSILDRMARRDAEQAEQYQVPGAEDGPSAPSPEQFAAYARAMFRYWTGDDFAASFRRMLTLEQYRSPEMGQLYQQYLAAGPMAYTAALLRDMGVPQPEAQAAAFYGAMFLLYSVCDAAQDRPAALKLLDQCLDQFTEQWKGVGP